MPLAAYKTKKLRLVFIVYWFLLAYIVAALIWWFIALNQQNKQMAEHEINLLKGRDLHYELQEVSIRQREQRKTAQYTGEGIVFFLVIVAGAVFIFRAVRRQLKLAQQQQHFMMAITHELKTPVAVAQLNLETLLKRKLDETQQQKLIQNSLQETNRLTALCNNILLVSQMEEGQYHTQNEHIELSELTATAVQEFSRRFPQRQFNNNIEENIVISGDRLLLQLAINNLIDNAVKYSPKDKPVTVGLQKNRSVTSLTVTDEGNGIADADKKKIFDKYYRTGNKATREAKGTGLGLYLAQKIAAQHQAKVRVENNQPAGSIFTIAFVT